MEDIVEAAPIADIANPAPLPEFEEGELEDTGLHAGRAQSRTLERDGGVPGSGDHDADWGWGGPTRPHDASIAEPYRDHRDHVRQEERRQGHEERRQGGSRRHERDAYPDRGWRGEKAHGRTERRDYASRYDERLADGDEWDRRREEQGRRDTPAARWEPPARWDPHAPSWREGRRPDEYEQRRREEQSRWDEYARWEEYDRRTGRIDAVGGDLCSWHADGRGESRYHDERSRRREEGGSRRDAHGSRWEEHGRRRDGGPPRWRPEADERYRGEADTPSLDEREGREHHESHVGRHERGRESTHASAGHEMRSREECAPAGDVHEDEGRLPNDSGDERLDDERQKPRAPPRAAAVDRSAVGAPHGEPLPTSASTVAAANTRAAHSVSSESDDAAATAAAVSARAEANASQSTPSLRPRLQVSRVQCRGGGIPAVCAHEFLRARLLRASSCARVPARQSGRSRHHQWRRRHRLRIRRVSTPFARLTPLPLLTSSRVPPPPWLTPTRFALCPPSVRSHSTL